jgi:5-methylcytosine-specific restriction endonuclease McrA
VKRGGRLQRRKPLKAKVALRRDKRLRASPKEPTDELTRAAQLAFYEVGLLACERDRKRRYVCPVCRDGWTRGRMQVHHVVEQKAIKRYVASLRLQGDELNEVLRRRLWDPRNALAVCTDCHTRHTNAEWRIPLAVVPDAAHEFAAELELEYLIERYYPVASSRG